ncbi:MAG: acetolactate synthase large subunit [Pseudomonadota bacterium]
MNGAQSLFKALVDAGIDTCFSNPGTSEMQLVYEMGRTDDVRPVLCLQENVATGAADGYGRMAGKPAFTLLHVGGGLANGIANLHNAGRANTPIVNIVGANASFHQPNFPEHELIGGKITDLARVVSHWTQEAKSASDLAMLGSMAARYAQTGSGKICTLVAPTNCHWDPAPGTPVSDGPISSPRVSPETVQEAADRLGSGRKTAILVVGHALREPQLEHAAKVAAKTGATLLSETFPSRMARGEGRISVPLTPYLVDMALSFFEEYDQVILIGALQPVATFAYQNAPTTKLPPDCEVWTFATPDHDIAAAMLSLTDAVGAADVSVERQARETPDTPTGALTPDAVAASVSLLMPDDSILVDEAATIGQAMFPKTVGARRHDYLYTVCGAAIGGGLPIALGAAVACPDRKVLAMQADGSGMYTVQALWSIARENCDVTIVILKNDQYGILNIELARVREGQPTDKMLSMLRLDSPSLNWVQIATGMGIPATHATTAEDFHTQLEEALAAKGPRLIEATVDQNLQPAIDFIMQQTAERLGR